MRPARCRGFSLLELSVVIVIISLLVGAVVAGQSLRSAATLRAVSTNAQTYLSAIDAFRTKYSYLPGDFPNATQVWGAQNATPATCRTTTSTLKLTCDGDGNGHISDTATAATLYEQFRAWQHLSNAGLVQGSFSGVGAPFSGSADADNAAPGTNVPRGPMDGSGYSLQYLSAASTSRAYFTDANYASHALFFGGHSSVNSWEGPMTEPILSTAQASAIDSKIDDGLPGQGKVQTTAATGSTCVTTQVKATATYMLSTPQTDVCAMIFLANF